MTSPENRSNLEIAPVDSGWELATACHTSLGDYARAIEAHFQVPVVIEIDDEAIHEVLTELATPTTKPSRLLFVATDLASIQHTEGVLEPDRIRFGCTMEPSAEAPDTVCRVAICGFSAVKAHVAYTKAQASSGTPDITTDNPPNQGQPQDMAYKKTVHNIAVHELHHAIDIHSEEVAMLAYLRSLTEMADEATLKDEIHEERANTAGEKWSQFSDIITICPRVD